jgi:antitoxin (DNA-binding transcriptional repressor) of toxin-antitoxin stability system
MDDWAVQDAKARLSEMLRKADSEPQVITHRGEPRYEVRAIQPKKGVRKPMTLLEALRACPKDARFELPPRRRERMRKADLG